MNEVLTSPTYLPFPMLFISLCWSEFPSVSFFFCLKNSLSISPSDELWSLLSETVFISPLFGRIFPLYMEIWVDSFFFWYLKTLCYCFWWEGSHHSYYCFPLAFKKDFPRTSLVAQWLGIHLSMQGTRVRALAREDPTCRVATKPVCHNYWACALEPACHNYWSPRT